MCNIRKGTSTRKPRLNQVAEQFFKIETQIEQQRQKDKKRESFGNKSSKHNKRLSYVT